MIHREITLLFALSLILSCSDSSGNKATAQSEGEVVSIDEYLADSDLATYPAAVFAGGCFWCTEASFERIQGVLEVLSGYSGGEKNNPTYESVSAGNTDHAESIYVIYDSSKIDYSTLLSIFFTAHDPTQVDRQGPDVGPQYRSAIFFRNGRQEILSRSRIDSLDKTGIYDKPIATELAPFKEFWVAEEYHQDYYERHPENPYIQSVSKPKVEKVEKEFSHLLKEAYR